MSRGDLWVLLHLLLFAAGVLALIGWLRVAP